MSRRKKTRLAKWKVALMVCAVGVVLFLCAGLFILRYVDIPGTQWDNFLDMRAVIEWELKVKVR
jgi:hypothetical protein